MLITGVWEYAESPQGINKIDMIKSKIIYKNNFNTKSIGEKNYIKKGKS